ncbi:PGAP1-like alpha/beta domain-containing protein [Cellulosimicrobium sp. 22601]|uniref:PGAP1-like alpha/beta domain-containing protein n=1 Tax=unclassified Cellulosimicrobium TaxID=2624466 RepID=UPI003F8506CC
MSGPRPAPVVVVRGGTEPTAVETAAVVAQAVALGARADLVAGTVAALRAARDSVDVTTASPTSFAGRLAAPAPFPATSGWDVHATPCWSAEVRAARAAALEAFDLAIGLAQEQERGLRDLASRLQHAVRVYDDADAAATALWQDLALLAVGGFSPVGAATAGLIGILSLGTVGVLHSFLEGRPSALRVVTSGESLHPATIRALSRAIGLLDADRPWYRMPTVGNGASVLRGLAQPLRDRFLPDPDVRLVDAPRDLPTPTDVRSALGAVDALATDSTLSVQRIVKDDGTPTWVVAIPGTQPGNLRSVFTMTSNYDLMDDDPAVRAQADSTRAVLEAMRQAGIGPDDDVVLVGHSQGGMIAATVAAATVGTYSVRHVVTAGSPVAGHALPPGVKGTHLETQGEGISDLDGAENRATPDRVTVTGTLPAPGGGPSLEWPHSVHFHQEVLDAAVEVGDRGLEEHLDDVERLLDGQAEEPLVYEARLVPDPDTTFCIGDLAVPRSLTPPWAPGTPFPGAPGVLAPGAPSPAVPGTPLTGSPGAGELTAPGPDGGGGDDDAR